MSNVLLSICIPTFNRADNLRITLASILSQTEFIDGLVEVVVSDNCSTDNTANVVRELAEQYAGKLIYFRNDVNIFDGNMALSLSRGTGKFLKLNNDTLLHKPGSLATMIAIIRDYEEEFSVLFFSNKNNRVSVQKVRGFNEFLNAVSYDLTWIGAFGIWKQDFDRLDNFNRHAKLQLTQVDVLSRMIAKDRVVFIIQKQLFEIQNLSKKGGYDLVTVFMENYFFLLEQAVSAGTLSIRIYKREKRRTLLNFLCLWIAKVKLYPTIYHFRIENWQSRIHSVLRKDPVLLAFFWVKYVLVLFGYSIRKALGK